MASRAAVFPTHAQRQTLGGVADEVVAQQPVERVSVARRQGPVQRLAVDSAGRPRRVDAHVRPGI